MNWKSTGGTEYTTKGNGTVFLKVDYNFESIPVEHAKFLLKHKEEVLTTSVVNPEVDELYLAQYAPEGGDVEIYILKVTENDKDVEYTKANTGVLRFEYKKFAEKEGDK